MVPSVEVKARKPVLLVEDNIDDAFAFSRALKALGHDWELFTVPDDEAAVRYLTAAAADVNCRPTAIFIDLKLGGKDGIDLIAWIRGKLHLRSCGVIALGGCGTAEDEARAKQHGARGYLTKPVTSANLAPMLTEFSPKRIAEQ